MPNQCLGVIMGLLCTQQATPDSVVLHACLVHDLQVDRIYSCDDVC